MAIATRISSHLATTLLFAVAAAALFLLSTEVAVSTSRRLYNVPKECWSPVRDVKNIRDMAVFAVAAENNRTKSETLTLVSLDQAFTSAMLDLVLYDLRLTATSNRLGQGKYKAIVVGNGYYGGYALDEFSRL